MTPTMNGYHEAAVPCLAPGTRYMYRLESGTFPDPASRFQPEGVHGPSEVVEIGSFGWTDQAWRGVALEDLVIYELHVGTFTPRGSYRAVIEKLPYLRDLGVTALELMPVADFSGRRNWGYDGVSPFAPARCYGRPEDLCSLVDAAHAHGLAVLLDVVYNHLGPDGNYWGQFAPRIWSRRHATPWGKGLNFDGHDREGVRAFFLENAHYWIHAFHFDGLRLDATFAIQDDSDKHFLRELVEEVRARAPDRSIHLIAEDHRNLDTLTRPIEGGGHGLDAQWSDDFARAIRVAVAGPGHGILRDYRGTAAEFARILRSGWLYQGGHSAHKQGPRGTDPSGIPLQRFLHCIQNHDEVGNRPWGQRIHHEAELAAYRVAVAILMMSSGIVLLFMGQEWAASTPFHYFTDHEPDLGRAVREGRERQFQVDPRFRNPSVASSLPDPQSEAVLEASRLDWSELSRPPHVGILELHRSLLRLRSTEPALRDHRPDGIRVAALTDTALAMRRDAGDGEALVLFATWGNNLHFEDSTHPGLLAGLDWARSRVILTTEDPRFGGSSDRSVLPSRSHPASMSFEGPRAILLRIPRAADSLS